MVLLYLLSDVLAAFRCAYPEIVLDIVVSNQLLNLSKRDADVAVRATYQQPDALSGRRLSRIAWAVFGPPELKGKPFDPECDVPRHSWIGFSDNIAIGRAAKWLKDRGGERQIVYRVNTMLGFAEAVTRGVGLALLPCFIGEKVPGLVRLCAPLPDLTGELWLLTHPDLRNTARVCAFADFCANEIGKRREAIECSN
jgi:DNA-binding transcriptional LysR family regulator